jgi:hypothetical protein
MIVIGIPKGIVSEAFSMSLSMKHTINPYVDESEKACAMATY